MSYLLLCLGLILLLGGGEVLVRGATGLAARARLSPMVIGLTVVAFGTSLPELVTSLFAALGGQPDIAVGNVVGSNIANALLILGVTALIAPIAVAKAGFARDTALLLAATALAIVLALNGTFGRVDGAILCAGLGIFLAVSLLGGAAEDIPAATGSAGKLALLLGGGLGALVLGANWFVTGAAGIARDLGVSEAVIGLSIVAIGTSLPELVTSVIAARRGQAALAFGNVIGSNIFNLLGILGITALVAPLTVAPQVLRVDLWVMTAATVLIVILSRTGWRIGRREGAVLASLYAAYIGWLALA